MKHSFFCLIFFLGLQSSGSAQSAYQLPETVERIVLLGNSITWNGEYINFIESYFRVRKQSQPLEFINVGLSSETVSGLSEPNHAEGKFPRPNLHDRLTRVLQATKPDLIIACYGMNDGIYLPFSEERFSRFKEGIHRLHEVTASEGIPIIHATPPIFDEQKGEAYANVLDIYSDWLLSKRYTSDWDVIDIHWPMKKYLEDQRLTDSSFFLAKDGIHPNAIGHWLMAKEILLFLGESRVSTANNIQEVLTSTKNTDKILALVVERQQVIRDYWLTRTGHERPGLPEGLPTAEAEEKLRSIDSKIDDLLN